MTVFVPRRHTVTARPPANPYLKMDFTPPSPPATPSTPVCPTPSSQPHAHTHTLTTLPPDLFAECLHFLPPAEISRTSLQLSKSFRNEESSERAAWLAIKHMASTAEKWTRAQNDNLTEVDPDAADARRLLKDQGIFGHLFAAKDDRRDISGGDSMTRFEDESWSLLYKLLRDVLDKVPNADKGGPGTGASASTDVDIDEEGSNDNNDPDGTEMLQERLLNNNDRSSSSSDSSTPCFIALTMWLAFGEPTLPPLSSANRRALSYVADRILLLLTSRSEITNQHKKKLKSRAIQMALRLGQLGCWDVGSSILDETIDEKVLREAKDDDGSNINSNTVGTANSTPIDIDCAISVTNFLIDRLYSQTYVRDSDEDTQALCKAAQLGRWAGRKASKRHAAALREKRRNNSNGPLSNQDTFGETSVSARVQNQSFPPPPVASIFSHDCMRFLHALLAQAKALALLAQHVALGASDVRTLDFFPVHRHPLTINPSTEHEVAVAAHIVASAFFGDSEEIFSISPGVMREQQPYSQNEKDVDDFLRLTYAFQASQGEHFYCAASANTRWSHPVFTPLNTHFDDDPIAECTRRSIRLLKGTFAQILSSVYEETMQFDYELLSLAIRTAKDLGKACDFAERTGNTNITSADSGMYLEFAYLCSCFLLGSKHPSSMNIKRLHRIGTENTLTIADRYRRIIPWLEENFSSAMSQ